MVILEDVADGYLLQCTCGTRLSCRHGHGVVECPKCATAQDARRLDRASSHPTPGVRPPSYH